MRIRRVVERDRQCRLGGGRYFHINFDEHLFVFLIVRHGNRSINLPNSLMHLLQERNQILTPFNSQIGTISENGVFRIKALAQRTIIALIESLHLDTITIVLTGNKHNRHSFEAPFWPFDERLT